MPERRTPGGDGANPELSPANQEVEVMPGQPAFAGRDQIFAFDDRTYEVVWVKEWNTNVRVRSLTGSERDAWEGNMIDQDSAGRRRSNVRLNYNNLRASLLVRVIVDEKGDRIFRDSDVVALGAKSAAALQTLFEVAQRLSGLSDEDVEELTKNSSGEAVNAENGSASPTSSGAR